MKQNEYTLPAAAAALAAFVIWHKHQRVEGMFC